jgi:predicted metal-dependent HD superfamily phosphohydrolase
MAKEVSGRADSDEITAAALIINATAAHAVPPGAEARLAHDCALFLDMDLAILGADAQAFDTYDRNIRQEFAMVPDEIFYLGRRKVIQGFLDRERIFLTDRFHASHDAMARRNLRRLIERLS